MGDSCHLLSKAGGSIQSHGSRILLDHAWWYERNLLQLSFPPTFGKDSISLPQSHVLQLYALTRGIQLWENRDHIKHAKIQAKKKKDIMSQFSSPATWWTECRLCGSVYQVIIHKYIYPSWCHNLKFSLNCSVHSQDRYDLHFLKTGKQKSVDPKWDIVPHRANLTEWFRQKVLHCTLHFASLM